MKTRGSGLWSDHKHLVRAVRQYFLLCTLGANRFPHTPYHTTSCHDYFLPPDFCETTTLSTFNLSPWLHSSIWIKHSFLSKSLLCFSDFIPSFSYLFQKICAWKRKRIWWIKPALVFFMFFQFLKNLEKIIFKICFI
jgi:hypothetical protein